jgi:UDP-2,3-diacylglucosamine pyrophosphatase LpxH
VLDMRDVDSGKKIRLRTVFLEHNEVLRAVLDTAREGTEVTYVPGNHDSELREFCGAVFGNLRIRRRHVHSTADGREFLVLHGDEFDTAVKCSPWLARFGAAAYDVTMRLNRAMNAARVLQRWRLGRKLHGARRGHERETRALVECACPA